jgi:hypothetical protein
VSTTDHVKRWLLERATKHANAFVRRALGMRALDAAIQRDPQLRHTPCATAATTVIAAPTVPISSTSVK